MAVQTFAVNLLAGAGFKNVYNITDGHEGDTVKDPGSVFDGQHMVNGWRNSGVPWAYDVDPARMVLPPGRWRGLTGVPAARGDYRSDAVPAN